MIRMKKGQISIFIIIGLVLLIIVGLTYAYLPSLINAAKQRQNPSNAQSFVQSCLLKSGADATHIITLHGGYINPPKTITIAGREIAMLNDNGMNLVPSMPIVKSQIENKAEELFRDCIDDFSAFRGRVQGDSPELTVEIYTDTISLMLDYDVEVTHPDRVQNYDTFAVTIDDIQLPSAFAAARQTVDDMISKKMYNLTLLKSLSMKTKAIDYADSIIFDFNDNNVLHLVFAAR